MGKTVILGYLALFAGSQGWCETQPSVRVQPVCGNIGNGIAVGKPQIYDDRMLALLIDSLEQRRTAQEDPQLTRQIANLRLLSARALSDRVLMPSGRGGQPVARAQALLGFQISLDSKEKYANALAEVELTITSKVESRQPAAIVSMLPKDKDSDVIALEKFSPTPEPRRVCTTGFRDSERDVTFAWQIRPAADRENVSNGTRQVYALLALPNASNEEFLADLHVHTHWRPLKKIKRKGNVDFTEESMRDEIYPDAIRYNPSEMETTLRPRITDTRFVANGERVVVIAEGENLLADTTVSLGASTIPTSGLTIQRERHLQFVAPAPALIQFDPYVNGRYGTPVPLVDPRAFSPQWASDPSWGLKVEYARARPKDHEKSELRIKLKSRQRKKPQLEDIVNKTLVSVAGRILTVTSVETEPTDSDALLVRFVLPTSALRQDPKVRIARLLGGDLFRDASDVVLEDDIAASRVNLLSETEEEVTLGIPGSGFSNLANVQIAGATYTRWTTPPITISGSNMITLRLKRILLQSARQLTVSQGFAQPLVLPLPEDAYTPHSGPAQPTQRPRRKTSP